MVQQSNSIFIQTCGETLNAPVIGRNPKHHIEFTFIQTCQIIEDLGLVFVLEMALQCYIFPNLRFFYVYCRIDDTVGYVRGK
jgi:hypothetical protein